MKRFPKWVLLLALAAPMYAQTLGSFTGNATQPANNVPAGAAAAIMTVPFATITVCAYPAVNSPCTNAVPIFFDQAGAQPLTQPITTDATGRFAFWVAAGTYSYSVVNQAGAVVGTYPFTVGGTGGGGSGCSLDGVPFTSVVYNSGGNCAGSANFITNSVGEVQIINGGQLTASLSVKSADTPSDNYLTTDGNHLFYRGTGAAGGGSLQTPGVDISIDDGDYTGSSAGIIGLFDTTGVYRAGKNAIGIEVSPTAGAAGVNLTNFEADEPHVNAGATVNKHWGFYSGMAPLSTDQITGENYGFLSEANNTSTPSNFCDFVGRDQNTLGVRVGLGCGPTHANTLNGTVQITTTTFSSLPACISGLEGTMRPVTDSTTNTWGATVTGGSTNHVLAYCNGTNWTVAAK
jgi:hypothetical protein